MSIIFFTICLEVMLTSERALSSVDPESYYNKNKLAVKHLLPSLSAAMILAILVGINCAGSKWWPIVKYIFELFMWTIHHHWHDFLLVGHGHYFREYKFLFQWVCAIIIKASVTQSTNTPHLLPFFRSTLTPLVIARGAIKSCMGKVLWMLDIRSV